VQWLSSELKLKYKAVPGQTNIPKAPPEAPSWVWSKITKETLILNITPVRQKGLGMGIGCEDQTWGLAGHLTSDTRCDVIHKGVVCRGEELRTWLVFQEV